MSACLINSFKTKIIQKWNKLIGSSFSDKYLFYTNVAISCTLSGAGDIIEQHYEMLTEELDSWDKTRTRNMSIYGVATGTFCHYWYVFLDKRIPGYCIRSVAKKIIVDQFVCSPICITSLFLTVGLLEGRKHTEVLAEFKQKAWLLYKAEWVIWPPAQFINFYFLPTRFRVLYDNTISLGYDIFTSYVKHNKVVEDAS